MSYHVAVASAGCFGMGIGVSNASVARRDMVGSMLDRFGWPHLISQDWPAASHMRASSTSPSTSCSSRVVPTERSETTPQPSSPPEASPRLRNPQFLSPRTWQPQSRTANTTTPTTTQATSMPTRISLTWRAGEGGGSRRGDDAWRSLDALEWLVLV